MSIFQKTGAGIGPLFLFVAPVCTILKFLEDGLLVLLAIRRRSGSRVSLEKELNNEKGLLIVFTGNGKGKTTAALGMAVRAAGHGMRVLILQFIKGAWAYGELQSLGKMEEIEIKPLGTGFTWKKESLEEDRRLAEAGWDEAVSEMKRGYYDMIVLDELNVVLSYGLLPGDMVVRALENRPAGLPHRGYRKKRS